MSEGSRIHFQLNDVKYNLKGKKKLEKWLISAAFQEGFIVEQIDVVFCSDKSLLKMNKKFLKHDFYTDILTFDYGDKRDSKSIIGEIFVSIDRVKENATIFAAEFDQELRRVLLHGVLHLCGYKDKTSVEQKKMRSKENHYLKLF